METKGRQYGDYLMKFNLGQSNQMQELKMSNSKFLDSGFMYKERMQQLF